MFDEHQLRENEIGIRATGEQFHMGNQYIGGVEQWNITNLDDLIKP